MCDLVFEKAKGRSGTVMRTTVNTEVAYVMRNFAKFTRNIWEYLF